MTLELDHFVGEKEYTEETSFETPTDDTRRVTPAIEFRDVHLAFDDAVVLDGVSFTVRKGETKIVLGGSGTGKSTRMAEMSSRVTIGEPGLTKAPGATSESPTTPEKGARMVRSAWRASAAATSACAER